MMKHRKYIGFLIQAASACLLAAMLFLNPECAIASGIRVVPSSDDIAKGDIFYVDIEVFDIPENGLGAIQFRLNVDVTGNEAVGVYDISQSDGSSVSVATPLLMGQPTQTRSGLGDFIWANKGPHGILIMDNEALDNGSALYTIGHTNGAVPASGGGRVARFYMVAGAQSGAERLDISLSDVMLLDDGDVYRLDENTGAVIEFGCTRKAPSLIGMTLSEATSALEGLGLVPGQIYEIQNQSGALETGKVLEQSYPSGATIDCQTSIDVAINTPPENVSNAVATDKAGDEAGHVVLTWTPSVSGDTALYRIYSITGNTLISQVSEPAATGAEIGLQNGQSVDLKITAVDIYGNESSGVVIHASAMDDVAPILSINGVGNGLYYSDGVTLSVDVQDAGAVTVTSILDGEPFALATIDSEGQHTLAVTASDNAGNSTDIEISFVIDKTPPTITVNGIEDGGYYDADVAPVITVADENPSGFEAYLNSVIFTNTTTISAEGVFELYVTAVDLAGNENGKTVGFTLDKTSPEIALIFGENHYVSGSQTFVLTETGIGFSATDSGNIASGLDKIEYSLNSGLWIAYEGPFSLMGFDEGALTLAFRAVDKAGNLSVTKTTALILDDSAPDTSLSLTGPVYDGEQGLKFTGSTTEFNLSADDELSGVAGVYFSLDGGQWTVYQSPISVGGAGSHILAYKAVDNLGNAETQKSLSFIVDASAPAVEMAVGSPSHSNADGTLYVSPLTVITLAAEDSGAGVSATQYRIDGGQWTAYEPFSIGAEGQHTVEYRSQDRLGNWGGGTGQLVVDATSPETALSASGPSYDAETGEIFVTGETVFSLGASDSLSGVGGIQYKLNDSQWSEYAPFTLADDGLNIIQFRSIDNTGNIEAEKTAEVYADNASPLVDIALDGENFTDENGTQYISNSTGVLITASDWLSGVGSVEYRLDGFAWTGFERFTVSGEGWHTVEYRSADRLGNGTATENLVFYLDETAPSTQAFLADSIYKDGKQFVTSDSNFMFIGSDSLSGLKLTEYRIDDGDWTPYTPFTLGDEGNHIVYFRSIDNVGNIEGAGALIIGVDNTYPETVASVGEPKYIDAEGIVFVTAQTPINFSASDAISGVSGTYYRVDGGEWESLSELYLNSDGEHTVEFRSSDSLGNIEPVKSLSAVADNAPPVSSLEVSGFVYESADAKKYVGATSVFELSASDGLSGVSGILYRVDGGQWTDGNMIALDDEGMHLIQYSGVDNLGNSEAVKSFEAVMDMTVPEITLVSDGGYAKDGNLYVGEETVFALNAVDNLSGIKLVEYAIGDGEWTEYQGPFTIGGESAGNIKYRSADNVGNMSAEGLFAIVLDTEAPESMIAVGEPKAEIGGQLYAGSSANISISSADDDSGIREILYSIDGGQWTAYIAPFGVSGAGNHTIAYKAVDNVGNAEAQKSLALTVDASAPETVAAVGSPSYKDSSGLAFVTATTKITLVAEDAGAGVSATQYRIDGGQWTAYEPFSLSGEGAHSIGYRSMDVLGNYETEKTLSVVFDGVPPVVEASVGAPKYVGQELYVKSDTPIALTAVDSGAGVASLAYSIDGGNWQAYQSFSVSGDGGHTISYMAQDNLGNQSSAGTLSVYVDDSAPSVGFSAGDPSYEADALYVKTSTLLSLDASDAGAGLAGVEYRIDSGNWLAYQPFSLTGEGTHTVAYRAFDRLGNTMQSSADATVDETSPTTDIDFGGLSYDMDEGKVILSKDSVIELESEDSASGVKNTYYRIDGDQWQAYIKPFGTEGLEAGEHTVDFWSEDNLGNSEDLRSSPITHILFDVKTVAVKKSRVLIWTDASEDFAEAEDFIGSALRGMNLYYSIVTDKDEFIAAMRSGVYDTIAIMKEDTPLDANAMREIRESVNRGSGLFVSSWGNNVHPIVSESLGIKFSGSRPMDERVRNANLSESDISPNQSLLVNGRVLKAELDGATAVAEIAGDKGKNGNPSETIPAITLNTYGGGRAVYMAFDLIGSALLTDKSQYMELLARVFEYIAPSETAYGAGSVVLVETSVTVHGGNIDGKAVEELKDGIEYLPFFDLNYDALEFGFSLADGETTSYRYFLRLPDGSGDSVKTTEIFIETSSGGYGELASIDYPFHTSPDSEELLAQAEQWLTAKASEQPFLSGSIGDLLAQIETLKGIELSSASDIESAIDTAASLIQNVMGLGFDANEPREMLGEYLRIAESRYGVAMDEVLIAVAGDNVQTSEDGAEVTVVAIEGEEAEVHTGASSAPKASVHVTAPEFPRILVWVNDGCFGQAANSAGCMDGALISGALDGFVFNIVTSGADFGRELRNDFYTDYVILGGSESLDALAEYELRERVYTGRGLIASIWSGMFADRIFGIDPSAVRTQQNTYGSVVFEQGEIFNGQTLALSGNTLDISALDGSDVVATLNGRTAAVRNTLGNGNALFFAFDMGRALSADNSTGVAGVLADAIAYIHRVDDYSGAYPYSLIPIRITVSSDTAMDAVIREHYPSGMTLLDAGTGGRVDANPFTATLSLNAGGEASALLYALVPDAIGVYTLTTESEYAESSSVTITVDADSGALALYAETLLDSLDVSAGEKGRVRAAKRNLASVRSRTVITADEALQNILELVSASEDVAGIQGEAASVARAELGRLLGIWQEKWYVLEITETGN